MNFIWVKFPIKSFALMIAFTGCCFAALDVVEVLFTGTIPVLFVEDVGHGARPLGVVTANEDADDEEELEFAAPARGELVDAPVDVNPPEVEVVVELPPPSVPFAEADALPRVVGAVVQLELLVETVKVLFVRGTDEKLLLLLVPEPGEEVNAK